MIQIITHTPIWVWFLLIFLIFRGIKSSHEQEFNLKLSFIFPLVFIIWGFQTICSHFTYIYLSTLTYLVSLAMGGLIGFFIYKRYQHFFLQKGKIYKKKSYLPLFIVLINFIVKYISNVILAMHPNFYNILKFNILYTVFGGICAGLFLGGIFTALSFKKNHFR